MMLMLQQSEKRNLFYPFFILKVLFFIEINKKKNV